MSGPDVPAIPSIALPQLPGVSPSAPLTFGSSSAPGTKPLAKPSQPSYLGAGLTAAMGQTAAPSLIGSFGR